MITYTETHLVEHCNLNCARCCHCSCLAQPEFANIDEFTKMATRIAELTKDEKDYTFSMMGGEPLLHPQFLEFCKIARSLFPTREVRVMTNGLLLSKQNDDFFNTVNNLNIYFFITQYPYKYPDNFDEVVHRLNSKFVWPTHEFFSSSFQLDGKRDLEYEFNHCHQVMVRNGEGQFSCALLKHGKIYPCSMAGNSQILHDYFNLNIEVEQGMDIFTHTKEEIENYLFHPCNFCKYCDTETRYKNMYPHTITKKERSEWIKE